MPTKLKPDAALMRILEEAERYGDAMYRFICQDETPPESTGELGYKIRQSLESDEIRAKTRALGMQDALLWLKMRAMDLESVPKRRGRKPKASGAEENNNV